MAARLSELPPAYADLGSDEQENEYETEVAFTNAPLYDYAEYPGLDDAATSTTTTATATPAPDTTPSSLEELLLRGRPRICVECREAIQVGKLMVPDGTMPDKKTRAESRKMEKEREKADKAAAKEAERQAKEAAKLAKKHPEAHLVPAAAAATSAAPKSPRGVPPTATLTPQRAPAPKSPRAPLSSSTVTSSASTSSIDTDFEHDDDHEHDDEHDDDTEHAEHAEGGEMKGPKKRTSAKEKRDKFKKKVRGALMTTGGAGMGTVAGAVIGGAVGGLMFGPAGLVAGAAGGAALGGVTGGAMGGGASFTVFSKQATKCTTCKVPFKKHELHRLPYHCRGCWMWYCDKCVPYEIVLEAREVIFNPFEPDEQTIAAITSKDHKATAKAEANSHVVKVDESTAALMSAKPETAKGAGQLRRAVRVREGHCSWCYKKNIHVCTEQSYITRNIWQCQGCLQRTLKCRNPTCQDMARGLVGYDEELCWVCQHKIPNWDHPQAGKLAREGHCSWCFTYTVHDPICHNMAIKVYKCRKCRNTTVPCSVCPATVGGAMARDTGFVWKGKCALHTGSIVTWDDVEGNQAKAEYRDRWCSWCVERTTHKMIGPAGLVNRNQSFICDNCHQRTFECMSCPDGMCLTSGHRCLRCKVEGRDKTDKDIEAHVMHASEPKGEGAKKRAAMAATKSPSPSPAPGGITRPPRAAPPSRPARADAPNRSPSSNAASSSSSNTSDYGIEAMLPATKSGKTFDEILERKAEIYKRYSSQREIDAELRRDSEYRLKATKAGYLRPFLLLISMEPQMRVLTAASLSIDIIRRPVFGDPHAEAWMIIDHPKKGLRFRTRTTTEEIVTSSVTWYNTIRRAMRATMKATTFKDTSGKNTLAVDFALLPALEVEFIERLSHWQHLLLAEDVVTAAEELLKNPEFQRGLAPLEAVGLGTPAIKRLVAEMFAEGFQGRQNSLLTQNAGHKWNEFDQIAEVSAIDPAADNAKLAQDFKSEYKAGMGSTYRQKADVVNWAAVTLPAAFIKLAIWQFLGLALATWLGPLGWVVEWGLSLALGVVLAGWLGAHLLYGPSHEAMTPAVVLITFQRLLLGSRGIDIAQFYDAKAENEVFSTDATTSTLNSAPPPIVYEDEDASPYSAPKLPTTAPPPLPFPSDTAPPPPSYGMNVPPAYSPPPPAGYGYTGPPPAYAMPPPYAAQYATPPYYAPPPPGAFPAPAGPPGAVRPGMPSGAPPPYSAVASSPSPTSPDKYGPKYY